MKRLDTNTRQLPGWLNQIIRQRNGQFAGRKSEMLTLIREALVYIRAGIQDEDGQAMAQLGLIVSLVAMMCLIALTVVGLVVSGNLYDFAAAVDSGSSALIVN